MVIAAQLGARQHYTIPAMFERAGLLRRFITDFWNPLGPWSITWAQKSGSGALVRAAARRGSLSREKVLSLYRVFFANMLSRGGESNRYRQYAASGSAFASACARVLDEDHSLYFGFSYEALEVLKIERSRGIRTVLDQTDPAHAHADVLREEARRFPELFAGEQEMPADYLARAEAEWEEADLILVNSAWTRNSLMARGVPEAKIRIVAIPYPHSRPHARPERKPGPLRVLWLGTLSLAKGFAYAIEAARLLEAAPVAFTFAGPLEVNASAVRWPANSVYLGQLPRPRVQELFCQHDVFLFPTLSDGFGLTQVEAMANGLPVIATPCCGQVVENRESGYVIPPRDPQSIAHCLLELLEIPDLLQTMSESAFRRSGDFSLEAVWRSMQAAMQLESCVMSTGLQPQSCAHA